MSTVKQNYLDKTGPHELTDATDCMRNTCTRSREKISHLQLSSYTPLMASGKEEADFFMDVAHCVPVDSPILNAHMGITEQTLWV